MKKCFLWLPLACVVCWSCATAAAVVKPVTEVGADGVPVQHGADFVSSPVAPTFKYVDVRGLPPLRAWQPGDPVKEIPRRFETPREQNPVPVNPVPSGTDKLAEKQREWDRLNPAGRAFTTPIYSFDGQGNTGVSPSDVNGDMGPNHYVQSINGSAGALIRIYSKTTGLPVGPQFSMASLGSGGACANGAGDPVVLYDELASRWVLTEFTSGANDLCFYLSAGSDPSATTWTRYNFTMPGFPDYPHYGIWPDAIYVGANEGSTGGQRPLLAFDRIKMLAGQPATFQRFTLPELAAFSFQAWQPADEEGGLTPPPNGAPGIFMRHRDDEVHNAGANDPAHDFIDYAQLHIDFATPANSLLSGPIAVQINEFSSDLNGLTAFNAFPQPNGQKLDPLREQVMNKLYYRNFGSHEALVGNFVTDVDGNDTGGIRWFELRRNGNIGSPWTLFQEGTYAPADAGGPADRWMAGSATDATGNIAMGYSITRQSPGIFPGVRYVGRLVGDTSGVMTAPETTLVDGGGSQSNERWGDYHSLSVDPVDGCTFWLTAQYIPTNNWSTRIGAFRFDECGGPTFTFNGDIGSTEVCIASGSQNLSTITLNVGAVNGFTDPVNLAFSAPLPAGFNGSLTPGIVNPPGSAALDISVGAPAIAGTTVIQVDANSGAINRSFSTSVVVSTASPTQVTLTSPADGAVAQPTAPVLSWSAVAQAADYLVEVATDNAFANIVFSQSLAGTNVMVAPALASNTDYYWRVTANNFCGAGLTSLTRQFRTQAAPGDCDVAQTENTVFFDDIESGSNGFTVSGTGASQWALSTARPFSGSNAWLAIDQPTATNQLLVSPPITIPVGELPTSLTFMSDETFEDRSANACWDGGLVEYSTDGSTWNQFSAGEVLVGPYVGAINSTALIGWCGDPLPYNRKLIDLASLQGQTVQFRFRVTTDGSVGRAPHGWYIDDIRVKSCAAPPVGLIFRDGFE